MNAYATHRSTLMRTHEQQAADEADDPKAAGVAEEEDPEKKTIEVVDIIVPNN